MKIARSLLDARVPGLMDLAYAGEGEFSGSRLPAAIDAAVRKAKLDLIAERVLDIERQLAVLETLLDDRGGVGGQVRAQGRRGGRYDRQAEVVQVAAGAGRQGPSALGRTDIDQVQGAVAGDQFGHGELRQPRLDGAAQDANIEGQSPVHLSNLEQKVVQAFDGERRGGHGVAYPIAGLTLAL